MVSAPVAGSGTGALEVLLVAPVDDRVVAGATAYDIVAVAALDGVVTAAVDRVGTGQAVDFADAEAR